MNNVGTLTYSVHLKLWYIWAIYAFTILGLETPRWMFKHGCRLERIE